MFTTRIAPSPTGMFHLGTARTAYFNYLAAKATGGKFILRIDDTDVERNRQEYVQIILNSLEWLGLIPDKTYYQSFRIPLYREQAGALVRLGKAKELDNGAIALILSDNLPEYFTDTLAGTILITETNKAQIEKIILLRGMPESNRKPALRRKEIKTGIVEHKLGIPEETKERIFHSPTYQFASIVDDYFMGVNWIIRGVDHITNTPKQIAIWQQLRAITEIEEVDVCMLPQFTHIGLIYKDKKKLSKRDNAASLLWYKEQGYSPETILNFILRMGWGSPLDDNKPISKEQAVDMFMKGSMRAAPAGYDEAKLNWYHRKAK
jgi:glutamyl-tRNA synthetase